MQRVAELRKDGMWSARRLPKVSEPARQKAHWDYLLEEMQWLAADFAQERKWKKAGARKVRNLFCARSCLFTSREINISNRDLTVTGLPRVREMSGKNKIFSRSGKFEELSGNFGHLTHVRELSGNFVMSCQGILS